MPRLARAAAPRPGRLAPRPGRWRSLAVGALVSTAAWGQAPAPEAAPGGGAQIQSLDRLQAEQERLRELARRQPPAYDDQFLSADDGSLLGGEANPTDAEPPGLR